jgi:hypothetical protein
MKKLLALLRTFPTGAVTEKPHSASADDGGRQSRKSNYEWKLMSPLLLP